MDSLESKVAVVTGAASGIGLGMARQFGHEGMRVVLSDVSEERLNKAVTELQSDGIDCFGEIADVRSAGAVDALAQAAVDTYGPVHVVCNNAGVGVFGRQWELSQHDWAWAIDICLWGVINGVRAFVPKMLASGEPCHVVNTASMGGLLSAPFVGPYATAKHAVVGLSKSLRVELGGTNVGVTLVCPGNVRTNVARMMREQHNGHAVATAPISTPSWTSSRAVCRMKTPWTQQMSASWSCRPSRPTNSGCYPTAHLNCPWSRTTSNRCVAVSARMLLNDAPTRQM